MMDAILHPLGYFYEQMQLPLPDIRQADAALLPEPHRSLLVHEQDMTPTLESAYQGKLNVNVLRHVAEADEVRRLVVLRIGDGPVGLGAIRICMTHLPLEARERILALREPFGRILQETDVTHYTRPVAWFDVKPDHFLTDVLGINEPHRTYGRRSTIWNSSGEELAEVVEVLPPSKYPANGRVS